MIINVLKNGIWNPIDSSMLDYITQGVYVYHFYPKSNINQQLTNMHTIERGNNVYKFGKFTGSIHSRIHGNNIGYTRHWRYEGREDHILTDRRCESYSFEDSSTRYLIFDASNLTMQNAQAPGNFISISDIESFFIDQWPIAKTRFIPRSEYYVFNENNDFLNAALHMQNEIRNFINTHQ